MQRMRIDWQNSWYRQRLPLYLILLLPFSWLFRLIVYLRRQAYRYGLLSTFSFPVPIIVVGNITVGGTGKTPLTIHLAKLFLSQGFRVGIVSRGVGGERHTIPHRVTPFDQAEIVGDEAILLLRETACPVMIGVDRVAAVAALLKTTNCNLVISDDGLQHYRLGRTVEIAVIDGDRSFGNRQLLPAGPLREPLSRLKEADFIVVNGDNEQAAALSRFGLPIPYLLKVTPTYLISLKDPTKVLSLADFIPKKVHAVAATGNPQKFFNTLSQAGLQISSHAFPDHYLYRAEDFKFNDALPIIMTAKDAVKCETFCDARFWYLSIEVRITKALETLLLQAIR